MILVELEILLGQAGCLRLHHGPKGARALTTSQPEVEQFVLVVYALYQLTIGKRVTTD
jgi:hypothetical protein